MTDVEAQLQESKRWVDRAAAGDAYFAEQMQRWVATMTGREITAFVVRATAPGGKVEYEQEFRLFDFPDAYERATRNRAHTAALFSDCHVELLARPRKEREY